MDGRKWGGGQRGKKGKGIEEGVVLYNTTGIHEPEWEFCYLDQNMDTMENLVEKNAGEERIIISLGGGVCAESGDTGRRRIMQWE